MAQNLFGALRGGASAGPAALFEMKAGKLALEGTTVTSDPRKGLITLRKDASDNLMHLLWKDRATNTVEDDLIVFEGDATLKHLPACTDGFAMLLEFTTGRRIFFWSQQPRKKDLAWGKDNIESEQELIKKLNGLLSGTSEAAPAPAPAGPGGFDGMTHSELMAMLSGASMAPTPAAAPAAAVAAAPAESATTSAPAAPAATSPASAAAPAPAEAAPAPAPAAGAFSADAISSLLSGIVPQPSTAAPAAGANFSAESIANILGGMAPAGPPVSLNSVLSPENAAGLVDSQMESRLAEHLPEGTVLPETAAATLGTPQMQQAAAGFSEALHTGAAQGLITEMGLNPAGRGVEPFLRALQEATNNQAAAATSASAGAEPMETEEDGKTDAPADKMEE